MHRLVVNNDQTNGDVSNHASNKHEAVDNCHGDKESIRSLKKKDTTLVNDKMTGTRNRWYFIFNLRTLRNI